MLDDSVAQLLYEHEELRREIASQERQSLQVLIAAVTLTVGLTSFAFSVQVKRPQDRALILWLVTFVAVLGIWHTLRRVHGSYLLASYLRTFTEARLGRVRWESRLKEYRKRVHLRLDPDARSATFPLLGELIMDHLAVYYVILVVSYLVGAWQLYQSFARNLESWNILLLLAGFLVLAIFGRWSYCKYRDFGTGHDETFTPIWTEVRRTDPWFDKNSPLPEASPKDTS